MGLNQDTYEIWIERIGRTWSRAEVRGEDLWTDREEAQDAAGDLAVREGVLQVIVIERKPILFLNGPVKAKMEKFSVVEPPRLVGNLGEPKTEKRET